MTTSELHRQSKKSIEIIINTLLSEGKISGETAKNINQHLFRIEDNPIEMLREMVINNDTGYYEVMKEGIKHKITVKMTPL